MRVHRRNGVGNLFRESLADIADGVFMLRIITSTQVQSDANKLDTEGAGIAAEYILLKPVDVTKTNNCFWSRRNSQVNEYNM